MPLRRQGLIQTWYDADISPGTQWEEEINEHLNNAQIILLLISPDFMASEYGYDKEMKRAMERHESGEARVIPIILRRVLWQNAPFGKLQALPKEAKPVRLWSDRDAAFFSVVEGILDAVGDLSKKLPLHLQGPSLEQFDQDIAVYTTYIERTLRNLKIAGVVPRYHVDKDVDIPLNTIFVPPRITLLEQMSFEKQYSLITLLEEHSHIVLLGGPGSGKSTVVRYLAWSQAAAHLETVLTSALPFLSDKPLPLRIELRRLAQDRHYHPEYDFLSYATQVILGREGIEVQDQMFKELLKQKRMLLLFDGLDEVATLAERRRLVEEIENFAFLYPGNRILVTSRLVGYELASCSERLFSLAQIQPFNDEQIQQFLELWYTNTLQISPIPYEEQQELEALGKILKDNVRLHKLAENPLLLTVITALYRHERLPDRRVQVYDKCAELLLERWAKLKGTDIRWEKMKMSREDQYACIAHLGFALHERSQEQENNTIFSESATSTAATASDLPAKLMLREIVKFLSSQHLIIQLTEQRAEAEQFLTMMQEETGLIVECGKDETGESLYGFIHQTFQEYFAAVDVYERFQQEQDPTLLRAFLGAYLHAPHWREVIFLLLGKLKRKPVTALLRQVLEGEFKSNRSQYTDILQQDLFFICDCFLEEISVETELAEIVISHLSGLVKHSHFLTQRKSALEYLGKLTRTRQYISIAKETLKDLTKDLSLDVQARLEVVRTIYEYSSPQSEEYKVATAALFTTLQSSELPLEDRIQALSAFQEGLLDVDKLQLLLKAHMIILHLPDLSDTLYITQLSEAAWILGSLTELHHLEVAEERQVIVQLLIASLKHSDQSIEQIIEIADAIYRLEAGQELANQKLLDIVQSASPTAKQVLRILELLYRYSPEESAEERYAVQRLMDLAHHPGDCFEQIVQIARSLYQYGGGTKRGKVQLGLQMLSHLAKHGGNSFENAVLANKTLFWAGRLEEEERQTALQRLLRLAECSDNSFELIQLANAIFFGCRKSEERQQANQIIRGLLQQSSLSLEQRILAAYYLYWRNDSESLERRQAAKILLDIVYRTDIPFEQVKLAAQSLIAPSTYDLDSYNTGDVQLDEEQQAVQKLWQLIREHDISPEQQLQIVAVILRALQVTYLDKVQAVRMAFSLLENDAARQFFEQHWLSTYDGVGYISFEMDITDISYVVELAIQKLLPTRVCDWAYKELLRMVPQFNKIQEELL